LAPRMTGCTDSMNTLRLSTSGGNLRQLLSGYFCIRWKQITLFRFEES
jgi:hypothetical protein